METLIIIKLWNLHNFWSADLLKHLNRLTLIQLHSVKIQKPLIKVLQSRHQQICIRKWKIYLARTNSSCVICNPLNDNKTTYDTFNEQESEGDKINNRLARPQASGVYSTIKLNTSQDEKNNNEIGRLVNKTLKSIVLVRKRREPIRVKQPESRGDCSW